MLLHRKQKAKSKKYGKRCNLEEGLPAILPITWALTFLVTAITAAYLLHPVFSPSGLVFAEVSKFFPNRLVYRSRHVLYFFSDVLPAARILDQFPLWTTDLRLILLFERPIRVGDIVSVGEHSGLVTRIQIRATTILNHDKRELIIPNKNFITGQIINWTLTDRVIRIVLPVGVAYDSDLKKVSTVLLRVASDNPKVLKDPAPRALLVNFGDSSLGFELRVFIPSPDVYPEFTHDLNVAIAEKFRKEGITIPFPQRDVHMIPAQPTNK